MTAQPASQMLLKTRADATQPYQSVGGLRTRRISLNQDAVDVTHATSLERWRELLAAAGVRHAEIAGSGVFLDDAADALVRAAFFAGKVRDWEIILPHFYKLSGKFLITNLTYKGEQHDEMVWDMVLESSGPLLAAPL